MKRTPKPPLKTAPPNGIDPKVYRKYRVPSAELLLQIVELLAQERDGLTQSELMERLQVSKAVIFRMTVTLLYHRWLERHPVSHRLSLSRRLLALGSLAAGESNLIEEALPVMRQLRDETKETIQLNTHLGSEGVILNQIPSTHEIRIVVDPGTRFQLHCTAPGKVILAFLPEAERAQVMAKMKFERHSDTTITDRTKFRQELEEIRRLGYGIDRAEGIVAGLHCVSSPILNASGYPVGALTVVAPSLRMPESSFPEIALHVIPHAKALSKKFGFKVLDDHE